jgi:hypothetical protein
MRLAIGIAALVALLAPILGYIWFALGRKWSALAELLGVLVIMAMAAGAFVGLLYVANWGLS